MPEHLETSDETIHRLRADAPVARDRRAAAEGVRVEGGAPARQALTASGVFALQRSVGNAGTVAFLQREEERDASRSPVHDVIGRGGSPLDGDTRSVMESHLGGSFGDVRLHVDAKSAESVQAAAFTVGKDIVVHPDHFTPGTPQAQRTLAHELTHVRQQAAGPVEGTPRSGGISVSDPSDRFEQEAESSAEALMTGVQRVAAGPDQGSLGVGTLQRDTSHLDENESIE